MAVNIRLSRAGRIHLPFYHIGVFDRRTRRDGRPIEALGFYDPENKKEQVRVDVERVRHWLSVGAHASPTVTALLKRAGVKVAEDAARARLAKAAKADAAPKPAKKAKKPAAKPADGAKKKTPKKRTASSKAAAEKKKAAGA